MAEATTLKFVLRATTGLMGAPTFNADGTLEPGGIIKVAKADITQALPPPNGITTIMDPSGRWGEAIMGSQETLDMSITGKIDPRKEQPIEVPFDSRFQFPHQGPLKAGETLKGEGSFFHDGRMMGDVPAELKLT